MICSAARPSPGSSIEIAMAAEAQAFRAGICLVDDSLRDAASEVALP
jgi:hypothetical protein